MWLILRRKTVFFNIYPLLLFDQNSCLNKSKFSYGFAPFQLVKKKISEYFCAPFGDSHFFDKKENISTN